MDDYLTECLKYNYFLGVDDIVDFVPNRKFDFSKLSKKDKNLEIKIDKESEIKDINKNEDMLKDIKSINELKDFIINKDKSKNLLELKRFSKQIVIGDGNQSAKILLIGEAPGEEEDQEGIPFCGRSGKLLEAALNCINLNRKDNFYITNSVFWRPLENRKPKKEEIEACEIYLKKIIEIINPKVIITVGSVATSSILKNEEKSISELIGKFQSINVLNILNCSLFPIYHPSYLLRNPSSKEVLWKNLLTLKKYLKEELKYDI